LTVPPRVISFIEDMIEHAELASGFVVGVDKEAFLADIEKQFAVVRALEIVGEAAKAIPKKMRELAPQIPWRQITAMRDKLIHHYFGVDAEIVWESANIDVPVLLSDLTGLLEKLKSLEY
jgi:uncharacterized protein with HEPN domain